MVRPLDLVQAGVQLVDGPAGATELWVDVPAAEHADAPRGVAVVAHPHPLMGGDAQHKIPALLARALAGAGWQVVRPNFRGVGRSAGTHDAGDGETDDVLALVAQLRHQQPGARLALVGFSFGAFVQARVARRLQDERKPPWRVALTGMPAGPAAGHRSYEPPEGLLHTLVVHGELDEAVPLAQVLQWARAGNQPVVVMPGADHFFSGKLHRLRELVLGHLGAVG